MARRPSLMPAALALSLACSACATTTLPMPVEAEVARGERAVPSERVVMRVQQSGSTMTVIATRSCDLRAVRTVDRAEARWVVRERRNRAVFPLLLIGNILGVGGLITIHTSLAISEETLSRDLAAGGALTAIGAALVTVGAVLDPNPTRVKVQRTRRLVDAGLVRARVPCSEVSPAAHVPVIGKVLGPHHLEIPFGDTDAEGSLVVNLADALPTALLRDPPTGATLPLYLGEVEAGTARLDEAARAVKKAREVEEAKHK